MAIKIENQSTIKIPKKTEEVIQGVLDILPREHLRGLNKVVLVDQIVLDSRLPIPKTTDLPGLYHPRQGNIQPWFEVAVGTLLSGNGFFKRMVAKLNFKPQLAYLMLSLQGQHYHLTLSHGIKKTQYENAVRTYVEQHHKVWREKQSGWRGRLFKPIQPFMEKWARKLRKKYSEQKRKTA